MSSDSARHKGRLAIAVLAGPALALVFQSLAYADVPWACRGGSIVVLHAMAGAFVIATILVLVDAFRIWTQSGRGTAIDRATVSDRSRFLALTGLLLSAASLLLVVAMWVPLFLFDPCVR